MAIDRALSVTPLKSDRNPGNAAAQRARIVAAILHNRAIEKALDENLTAIRDATRRLRIALAELE